MSIKDNKARITAIITEELEQQLVELANQERRSKSSMTAILIEEAIVIRMKGVEDFND